MFRSFWHEYISLAVFCAAVSFGLGFLVALFLFRKELFLRRVRNFALAAFCIIFGLVSLSEFTDIARRMSNLHDARSFVLSMPRMETSALSAGDKAIFEKSVKFLYLVSRINYQHRSNFGHGAELLEYFRVNHLDQDIDEGKFRIWRELLGQSSPWRDYLSWGTFGFPGGCNYRLKVPSFLDLPNV